MLIVNAKNKSKKNTIIVLMVLMSGIFFMGWLTHKQYNTAHKFLSGRYSSNIKIAANYTMDALVNELCAKRFPLFKNYHSCLLSKDDDPQILILGDSHGAQYYKSVREAFPDSVVMNLSEFICFPFVADSILENNPVNCAEKIEAVKSYIQSTGSIEKILIVGHWQYLIDIPKDDLSINLSFDNEKKLTSFIRNGINFIGSIKKSERKIILFRDNPEFDFDIRRCLGSRPLQFFNNHQACIVSLDTLQAKMFVIDSALDNILLNVADIEYFDPKKFLCNQRECSVSIDSAPLYFDGNHLNYYGAERVVKGFVSNQKNIN